MGDREQREVESGRWKDLGKGTSSASIWRDRTLSKPTLYFAYGSNLSQEDLDDWKKGHPKHAHVDLKLKKAAIGFLPGYRLGFTRKSKSERRGFMGVADIVKVDDPKSRVRGVIFSLNDEQAKAIRPKEGFFGVGNLRNSYEQIKVEITDQAGAKHSCLTYEAVVEKGKKRKDQYYRPLDAYCDAIRKGGEEHKLPEEFFEHLRVASVTERNPVGIRMNDTSGMVLLDGEDE
jgi:hypothetical protein